MFTANLSLYKSLNKTCNILGPELGLLLAKSTSMKNCYNILYPQNAHMHSILGFK